MPTQEPLSEVSAVLRREAEQLARLAATERWAEWHLADQIEAFAHRQRAQALKNAAKNWPPIGAEAREIVQWLRARAAAEGTTP